MMKKLKIKYILLSVLVVLAFTHVYTAPGPGLAQEPVPQLAPMRPEALEPPPPGTGFVPLPMDLSHLKGDRMPEGIRPAALPSSFDWRTLGMVTPVENQNPCGACYAFAALGNFESKILIDGQGAYNFSQNNAKECTWHELSGIAGSCAGGNFYMLADLFSTKGTVLESCDPYVPSDVACNSTCPYQKTLLDWRIISGDTEVAATNVLKNYIYTYGPVYTAMYSSFPGFNTYDGSYTLYYAGPGDPDHAVLIVGWDDSLSHAGGTGGWIVKNSWGTSWGGTCGYGTEGGYFTIAYGSASIGTASSFIYDWQDYDATGQLMYYDDGGWSAAYGYGNTTGWGLCKFIPSSDENVTRVEFWTTDQTTDVDVYIYDSVVGGTPTGLLASKLNNSFNEAGYHSVALDSPLAVTTGDDVIAVVKFTNDSFTFPIAVEHSSAPHEYGSQHTYISSNGSSWSEAAYDVGIRLRTGTVSANNPPHAPSNPSPADGATNQDINVDLGWTGGDPDPGDTVTYDVYFEAGDPTPDSLLCDDVGTLTCDPGTLAYNTHYYWYVVATDDHSASTTGDTWDFITASASSNNPPHAPGNPSPADGAANQDINVDLGWTGGDPDPGDTVTYDVYFEASDPTPDNLLCDDVGTITCDPGTLAYGTHYYWHVIATDNHSASTPGDTWDFTTESADGESTTYLPIVSKASMTNWHITNSTGGTLTVQLSDVGTENFGSGISLWVVPSGWHDVYITTTGCGGAIDDTYYFPPGGNRYDTYVCN